MRFSFSNLFSKSLLKKEEKRKLKSTKMKSEQASISKEEMNSLKEAFSLYDTNQNGAIDLEHFATILKSLNINKNDEEIKAIVEKLDKNHDGQIDFDEFVNAMTNLLAADAEENGKTLRRWKTFPDVDKDNDNNNDNHKQKQDNTPSRQHYSRRMSRHETDDLRLCFGKFDKNGDGLISEDELKEVMNGLGERLSDEEIKDMMKDADTNQDGYIDFQEFKALMPTHGQH
ncbi:MAG: hypothetical protein EXX96DRAFT_590767, partial [Benjaminiella poitrasii]